MKIVKVCIVVCLALPFSGCEDLTETNINPNESVKSQPDYLLSNVIKSSADTYWGVDNNMNSTLLFAQHWAKIQYTDQDRYIFSNTDFTSAWTNFYSRGLTDIAEIIRLAEAEGNNNYIGVAIILRSWIFSTLTDLYGDVPYRQAVRIQEYLTPQYDPQEEVYTGILNDLKTADGLIDANGKAIAGDLLYNGDLTKWKKFGNSLRLRLALRIADRKYDQANEVIEALQGAPLISDNAETAQLRYLASPNQNPVGALFETRDDYRISETIVQTLKSLNDPRLPVYANKTETVTAEEYIGVPNGLTNGDASNLGFSRTSKIGTYFTKSESPAVIMSYAEVLFNRAEAAARGFTAEDPASLYNAAIVASLKQFGIQDASIATYLAQPSVQYDAVNYLGSIGTQKWIALFGQGIEAFTEWRRLDYPQLAPARAGALNGKIPVRFIYPGSEQSLNLQSYKDAVNRQGPDVLTTKLWFDKN